MSRERAQAIASRQLASVGSETTAGTMLWSKNAGYCSWDRTNLYRTPQTGGRFGIPERRESEGWIQRLRGKRLGPRVYIFHRGQLCYIGVSKDSDLDTKDDQFSREIRLGDRCEPCELSCS